MGFQLIVAVVNTLLLLLKILAYVLVKRSFLLMMVIDNLADMLFSLILSIPNSKCYNKKYSRIACCRFMQLAQVAPVLMFIPNLYGSSLMQHKQFTPYMVSILILAVQLVAKSLLYGCFKSKNFSKETSEYLLLQDQIYDMLCTFPGLLSLLLIISFDEKDENIIDYVTTVILFALTISFWERTLVKTEKPKFESLHSVLSNRTNNKRNLDSLGDPTSSKDNDGDIPQKEIEKVEKVEATESIQTTPSPQFERKEKRSEISNIVEIV